MSDIVWFKTMLSDALREAFPDFEPTIRLADDSTDPPSGDLIVREAEPDVAYIAVAYELRGKLGLRHHGWLAVPQRALDEHDVAAITDLLIAEAAPALDE